MKSGTYWRWMSLAATGSGFYLCQLGCRSVFQRELDLFSSPTAILPLQLVPLSQFFGLFRLLLS